MNLSIFNNNLFEAGTEFFNQLGIQLNSNTASSLGAKELLKDHYKDKGIFKAIAEAYFLGLVDDSVFDGNAPLLNKEKISLKEAEDRLTAEYNGLMVFAVWLKDSYSPTRGEIADLTRAFNRVSKSVPVVLLLKYGGLLSFAASERTKYKQAWREGEKIGKISLLKDIDLESPHTGHLKILYDLKVEPDVTTFDALYKQWQEVFNVQLLNKKFYQELANWYFWAIKNVEFPKGGGLDEKVRNAMSVIRLLTRLIFIWFIKEKRLVPDDLFAEARVRKLLKNLEPDNSTYYKSILQNFFFATLNTDPKETPRRWRGKNKGNGQDSHYLIPNVYRYKEVFHAPDEAFTLFQNIPFLNGGLFECLDKEIKDEDLENRPELANLVVREGRGLILRIDGFSERKENPLHVPNKLFFSDEQIVDLNEIYGTKNKTYKVRGLINILDSYKFTVDENTPVEEEIALDPELLGKVFENLLASYVPETGTTARKQTGSFYTPREIVNYMVDESLIAYLTTALERHSREGGNPEAVQANQNTKELDARLKTSGMTENNSNEARLRHLVAYNDDPHRFNPAEVDVLIAAINTLKALDPACGSGAFPMGMLHKLVYILGKLDPDNSKWRELQRQKAIKETEDTFKIDNKEERIKRLFDIDDAFENNSSDYGRKLYLIENCLFGVDIQPIAVQIAKLRFFISLIVDQNVDPKKENLGVRPLPNLETKFVAANTLIGVEKPEQGKLRNLEIKNEIDRKEVELKKVRERHFTARTPQTKEKCRKEDERLRAEISELLKKDGFPPETTKKLAKWNPYDQNESADFFDPEWMFEITKGFDIVFGNPPYIKEYTHREAFDGVRESPYYQGKMDIWYLFACLSLDMLRKDTGILTFIATNNWVTNTGASKMRNKFIRDAYILKMLDFGNYKIFESADIQTMVMLFMNNGQHSEYTFDYRKLYGSTPTFNDVMYLLTHADNEQAVYLTPVIKRIKLIDKPLTFSDDSKETLLDKIQNKANFKLNENKEVAQGIVAPQDFLNTASQKELGKGYEVGEGIFCISNHEKRQLGLGKEERELVKPYFTTSELHKYYGNPKNEYWVIYTDSSFKNPRAIQPYPNLKRHLDRFKSIITSDNAPYGLHRARKEYFFKGDKIISLRKCAEPTFTYTAYDCYVSQTFFVIKSLRINMKFLTALLNSQLIAFWLRHKGKMQGHQFQVDKEPLLEIPIVNPNSDGAFTKLVDQILTAKQKDPNADTSTLEKQIDEMVYALYGLTPEEIVIVEGKK